MNITLKSDRFHSIFEEIPNHETHTRIITEHDPRENHHPPPQPQDTLYSKEQHPAKDERDWLPRSKYQELTTTHKVRNTRVIHSHSRKERQRKL